MNMMEVRETIEIINTKFEALNDVFTERSRRMWAGTEAQALGWGGITIVTQATGLDEKTISRGIKEIDKPDTQAEKNRIRRRGGGRRTLIYKDETLTKDLQELVEPVERGDPERSLRWSSKSTYRLAEELQKQNHSISQKSVHTLLDKNGYSMQSNKKRNEGNSSHIDRDAQFRYINDSVVSQQKKDQPCISIDTKKKENVGNYKNNGQEWSKKGEPVEVNMHDFPDKKLGKAIPHGIYDLIEGKGWVTLGIDHDTAVFAVASIKKWWESMGKKRYPKAEELLITADCGGSNNARSRLWKVELQKLANTLNLIIHIRHFPPGTSKWNKIEHRLFSMITKNWRGKPLTSLAIIINLIGSTKTKTGLTVKAVLDLGKYPIGIKVSHTELAAVNIIHDDFHGEWNYSIIPQGP
jgi:hypothetical protein